MATFLPAFAATQAAHAADAVPSVSGQPCAPGEGVTVVVDFLKLGDVGAVTDRVEIGCAEGAQDDGFAALQNAGFGINESGDAGYGTVCQIEGLPTTGYPDCWYTGYWSYWTTDADNAWDFRQVGAGGTGELPVDTVEGWSYTLISDDWESYPPRITAGDLPDLRVPDLGVSSHPSAPAISPIAASEVLPLSGPAGSRVEAAVLTDGQPDSAASWSETTTVALAPYVGQDVTLLLREVGTTEVAFRSDYQVRESYAPGHGLGTADNPDISIPTDSDDIVAWATGFRDYAPGDNVNDTWKTPEKAVGPIGTSYTDLVVLGDRGTITMTFDEPIGDGEGPDLAVFENGFRTSGNLDSLELGKVAVSSNGTDFAAFDSASLRDTPVGGYEAQVASNIGGLAGRDVAGQGTPFDLATLRNHDLVRAGKLDLNAVTEVKVIDVLGDGTDLDSFGRPIYDPTPTWGSGGFDLTGVAVLNEAPAAPATLSVTAPATRYGQAIDVSVDVSPAAAGEISVVAGGRTLTAPVNAGTATVTVPARTLNPGARTLAVSFASADETVAGDARTTAKVTVRKAVATVNVKKPAKVRRGKTARFVVRVKAPGAGKVTGKVRVKFAGKTRTVKVVNGRAVVKVKVRKKFKTPAKGRQVTAQVRYLGSGKVVAKGSKVKVRVTR